MNFIVWQKQQWSSDFGEAGNIGFRQLFRYIQGTNQSKKKLPVSIPVIGLIFLKFADNDHQRHETEIVAKQLGNGLGLGEGESICSLCSMELEPV